MAELTFEIKKEGKFEFIEEGQGETLMLLHGLFGALSNFADVLEAFKDRYRVVIPLMPIYEMPLTVLGVKGLADFVHEFIKYKNYNNIVMLGNSLGGHVTLVYMKHYPERIKSLVLTGSSGLYENAMGDTYPKRGDRDYIRKKVEYTFYNPATATDELIEEVFEITNNRNKVIRVLALAKSAIRHNMRKDIIEFNVPVCLIWGKQDNVTPPHVAEEFQALLPNSKLYWIDQCGHAAMMEQPQEFNRILNEYLSDLFSEK